jgi:hypothetical protein
MYALNRPIRRQWFVIWAGAICTLVALVVAEEYLLRAVFGVLLVTVLLYWQLTPTSQRDDTVNVVADSVPEAFASSRIGTETLEAALTPPIIGIRGWLALLVFGIGIGTPLGMAAQIPESAAVADGPWEFGGGLAVLVGVASFGIYTGIGLLRRWPNAPRLARWYLGAVCLLTLIGLLVELTEGKDPGRLTGQAPGTFGGTGLWSAYLLKSRRVKNTYGSSETEFGDHVVASLVAGVAAALLIWLGLSVYRREESRVDSAFLEITPQELVSASREMGDAAFSAGFERALLQKLQASFPDSTVKIASPKFEDLSLSIRASAHYDVAIAATRSRTVRIEGDERLYYHDDGIAVIESACNPAAVQCEGMDRLLAEAEDALLSKIGGTQLSAILPRGKCETDVITNSVTRHQLQALTCSYAKDDAALLTITRYTRQEASAEIRSRIPATSEIKRAFVRKVLAQRERSPSTSAR